MPSEPTLHERRFRERLCCRPIVSRSVTLPVVAMAAVAAAVPTFSWTYKAGQPQRPLLLCPEHLYRRGHLDGGAPSAAVWGFHFSQLYNARRTRSQKGARGVAWPFRACEDAGCIKVPWEKTKLCCSSEGFAENHDSRRMRYRLLAYPSPPHSQKAVRTCNKAAKHMTSFRL